MLKPNNAYNADYDFDKLESIILKKRELYGITQEVNLEADKNAAQYIRQKIFPK